MNVDIQNTLKNNAAFQKLAPASLEVIARASQVVSTQAGEVILNEGAHDQDLVLLVSGIATAFRKDADSNTVDLNEIQAGDCIGELAFLDAGPRTASVKAQTDCTLIRIHGDKLQDPSAVGDLKASLATVVVKRARLLSDNILASTRAQLEAANLQNQFGYFLIFTIAILLVSTMLYYLVAEDYVKDVYDPGFSWQTVLFFAVPCVVIIWTLKIPMRDLGIRREGLWRSIWQSLLFCTVITTPVIAYMAFTDSIPAADERPVQITTVFLLQYFLHTVFQEIGSRGLIQNLFVKFLNDSKGHKSVLLTSVIFSSLHVTLGLDAVILTFFASIMFGYIFHFQKNLAGVILIHYWFGVLAALLIAL